MEKATRFEKEAAKLKTELKDTFNTKIDDKATFDNEILRIRNEANREVESDRKKHEEELKQLKSKQQQQRMSIEKVCTLH